MDCPEYQRLLPKEKVEFVGMLLHACQSHSTFYEAAQKIIRRANKLGVYEGVAIQPDNWSPVPESEPEE